MNKKPVIGISMSMLSDTNGVFAKYPRAYVNDDYIRSVNENGGIALTLPICEDEENLEYYTDIIDGLILSGGHDINPHLYSEEIHPKTGDIFPRRDTFDMVLLKKMLEKNKPVFGICRGFQLINVAFGGSLVQDLDELGKNHIKHWQDQDCAMPVHKINFKGENFFTELYGKETFTNSWHHQVLKDVAEGFEVCGRTSDGVIEAIEDKKRNIIAVQWHPEMMSINDKDAQNLFKKFIQNINKGV